MAPDRRKMIVAAATKSFSLFGYKATTMDQVAKLANVGKGTIYTFFKNKEELFEEIISSLVREMIVEADSVIQPKLPFTENVHRALYRLLEFRSQHQLMIKLVQEEAEMGTLAVSEMLQHVENEIIAYLKQKIETAISKGAIPAANTEITSFLLLKMYIALVSDWERNHAPLSSEQIAEIMKVFLLQGLPT
ncbi:TetR/AcrR family transcriptional regulator [Neobacillus vireti]|uniref:TetR/AcrR family transcriptional regulator n=1 Tax=Neobacillus vireti LMG 21834 TaxID=1131730 RepID=A0AB94IMK1_9BACI|nr:TetR/AcrR family transcriptional regulator [Neobacillus vireti]ETI68239.1 TetR/AcrR family transcriptional regulator [Neobacillus vireti LMG 21834]KLT20062.1 TetR family transcriptional regulator [Neobacillus vireti]